MMMVKADEWVRKAMMDESVVVELLVRLKHSESLPFPLTWGLKQPRSRSTTPTTPLSSSSRSKASATATSEYTGSSTSTKRCKRKKEIANLSNKFKVQRGRNESLKRIKLDLGPEYKNNLSSTSDEFTISKVQTHVTEHDDTEPQSDFKADRSESTGESIFLIPDLNMMPSQDDSLCGMT